VDLTGRVAAALARSAPQQLARALHECLAPEIDAQHTELYLADYGQVAMNLVSESAEVEGSLRIDGTVAGRAFAAQAVQVEQLTGGGWIAYAPVSVRGDRLGVLAFRLAANPDPGALAVLADLGELIGHELVAAGRATDVFQLARRSRPLTLAAEIQWQLLPGGSLSGPGFSVAGQLEPAYSVAGDGFDWTLSGDTVQIVVCDGPGRGVGAALVTTLGLTALRNARRLGADLSEQASLADQALFAEYGGERFVSALLVCLDVPSGLVTAVDAGSPQLIRMHGGLVEPVQLEPQLPLGMFEETRYEVQPLQLEPGDRLVVVSDGAAGARGPGGEAFVDAALDRAVRAGRLLPCGEAVRTVMRALAEHRRDEPLGDDAVVVCLDWRRGV
jgi:serine phosphatase RsbU (regulator of sigma subunit)